MLAAESGFGPPCAVAAGASQAAVHECLENLVAHLEGCADLAMLGSLESLTARLERLTASTPGAPCGASGASLGAMTEQLEGLVMRMEAAAA